mmetsp:Transcript_20425/g.68564  ORF Transcript_20425/g.68564 Transcript_20425/m.68564 type:complete len:275 (-) Transcript_20425:117-941(-)
MTDIFRSDWPHARRTAAVRVVQRAAPGRSHSTRARQALRQQAHAAAACALHPIPVRHAEPSLPRGLGEGGSSSPSSSSEGSGDPLSSSKSVRLLMRGKPRARSERASWVHRSMRSTVGSLGSVCRDCFARMALLSSLAVFWRCEESRRCPTGDAWPSSKARSAMVRSSSSRNAGSSPPAGASCSCAYASASSTRPARMISMSSCWRRRKARALFCSRMVGSMVFTRSTAPRTSPFWIFSRSDIRSERDSRSISGSRPASRAKAAAASLWPSIIR